MELEFRKVFLSSFALFLYLSLSISILGFFFLIYFTLIVSRIDDGNDSGRLLDTSAGRTGEAGTRAAAGIVDALTQRLQPIHVHHCRRDGDDDANDGAD